MYALRCLPVCLIGLEFQLGVNSPDDQDTIFHFDLAHSIRGQAIVGSRNLTRLQRASKGAGKSAGRRCNDVIQRGRVRLQRPRRHLVVLGHCAVHSENHRLALGWEIRPANRPLHALDSNFGTVHNVGHAVIVAHALLRAAFTLV
jgi:hypothetical protein